MAESQEARKIAEETLDIAESLIRTGKEWDYSDGKPVHYATFRLWLDYGVRIATAYIKLLTEQDEREKRLRKVAHELVGFVRGGYGDSGDYAGTLRLIAEHADEALTLVEAATDEGER
jgi:hypothetical protein